MSNKYKKYEAEAQVYLESYGVYLPSLGREPYFVQSWSGDLDALRADCPRKLKELIMDEMINYNRTKNAKPSKLTKSEAPKKDA